jgi:hypothetical protein
MASLPEPTIFVYIYGSGVALACHIRNNKKKKNRKEIRRYRSRPKLTVSFDSTCLQWTRRIKKI